MQTDLSSYVTSDNWYLNPFGHQSVEGERKPKGTGAECHYRGSYMRRHGQKHVGHTCL